MTPDDDLFRTVFRTGVEPSPSSLRRASAVSASIADFDSGAWFLEGVVAAANVVIEGDAVTPAARAPKLPVELDPEKLFVELEPRRNWLIEALEGLGGR
jgi:hypothetical protein